MHFTSFVPIAIHAQVALLAVGQILCRGIRVVRHPSLPASAGTALITILGALGLARVRGPAVLWGRYLLTGSTGLTSFARLRGSGVILVGGGLALVRGSPSIQFCLYRTYLGWNYRCV